MIDYVVMVPTSPKLQEHKLPSECGIKSGLVYCWHPQKKRWVGFEYNETATAMEHGYTHWMRLPDGPSA